MSAVLLALALGAAIAALVIFDAKPWRRFVLTVTITADTTAFDAAMKRVMESVRQFSDGLARAGWTAAEAADHIWRIGYQFSKHNPQPSDDPAWPRFHLLWPFRLRRGGRQ